ncbi:MAG: deoxyribose-phosphate aldolase, partial [Bacteroidia bacterium]|nr:deoxyribose-phosphate aldolase [Bacteroidia bacterium]
MYIPEICTEELYMSQNPLGNYIDYTLLKSDATQAQIEQLCKVAVQHKYYAVCIPPCYVSVARNVLLNFDVKVCTVIGFPLGNCLPELKIKECEMMIEKGVKEIDAVMNIGRFKSGQYQAVEDEIRKLYDLCSSENIILKVI